MNKRAAHKIYTLLAFLSGGTSRDLQEAYEKYYA